MSADLVMLSKPEYNLDQPNFNNLLMDPAFVQQQALAQDDFQGAEFFDFDAFLNAPAPEPAFDPSHPVGVENNTLVMPPMPHQDFGQPTFDNSSMDPSLAQQQIQSWDNLSGAQFFDLQAAPALEPGFNSSHLFNVDNSTLAMPPIPYQGPPFAQQQVPAGDSFPDAQFFDLQAVPAREPAFDPSHPFNIDNNALDMPPMPHQGFGQPTFDNSSVGPSFAQQQVPAGDNFPEAQFFDPQAVPAREPAFDPSHPFNVDNNALDMPPIPHNFGQPNFDNSFMEPAYAQQQIQSWGNLANPEPSADFSAAPVPQPMFYQGPNFVSNLPAFEEAANLTPAVDQGAVAQGEANFPQGAPVTQALLPTPEPLPQPPMIVPSQPVLAPQEPPAAAPSPSQFAFTFQAPRPQPDPNTFAGREAARVKARLILFRLNQRHHAPVRERILGSVLKPFLKLGLQQSRDEAYQAILDEGIPIYIRIPEDWDAAFGLLGDAAFSIFRRKEFEKAQSMGTTLPDLKPALAEYLNRYPPCEEIDRCFRELQDDEEEDF